MSTVAVVAVVDADMDAGPAAAATPAKGRLAADAVDVLLMPSRSLLLC